MLGAMSAAIQRQIKSARQHLNILASSSALKSPEGYIDQRKQTLELLKNRLISAQTQQLSMKKQRYIAVTAKLDAMSPLKVLTRGYAMAQKKDGTVLRSVKQVEIADEIAITIGDGKVSAMVTDVKENG